MLKKLLYNSYIFINFLICYLPISNSFDHKIGSSITTQDIINGDVFFEIIYPNELEYTYRLKPAKNFGRTFDQKMKFFSVPMINTIPWNACDNEKYTGSEDLFDTVALVQRGECSFMEKTKNVELYGGLAIIITDLYFEADDTYIEMVHDNESDDVNIPAGYLVGKNGRIIINTLKSLELTYAIINLPVNLTFTPPNQINLPPWQEW